MHQQESSKGIVLLFWGNRGYAHSAYNLAMSIKKYSNLPIFAYASEQVLKYTPVHFFDNVEVIEEPTDPGLFKAHIYDYLPYDHNLFLDVDALCLRDIIPTFDKLIKSEKPYRCFVYGYYDKTSPNEMPLMRWAYREDIWSRYGLDDHILPATQSSLQYIRKGEFCDNLFKKMRENFANPIPLNELREKWGGTQPDELYLNITLAQLGYDPQCENVIFFGNDDSKNYHEVKQEYDFLSLFGGRGMIKPKFLRSYDIEVKKMGSKFKHADIIPYKHANARSREVENIVPARKKALKITLLTSYYNAKTPERQAEIDRCLEENIRNPFINEIVLFGNKEYEHDGVSRIPIDRPTYKDFFEVANKMESDIFILANSDIYFDQSLNVLFNVSFDGLFLALSRHDVQKNGRSILFDASGWGRRGYSQDAWVWSGKIPEIGDYKLGLPGCDNKIAYDMDAEGYRVKNPAREVKLMHLHITDERNYTQEDRLPEPYMNVPICRIKEVRKKTMLIKQPGKVGDIILCLPIAKHYSKTHDVYWECPSKYHSLFSYVDYVTPLEKGNCDEVLDLSFGLSRGVVEGWWQKNKTRFDSFVDAKYELAKIPFSKDLDYKRDLEREDALFNKIGRDSYKLVHGSSDYGTPLEFTGEDIIHFRPIDDFTIFDWRKVIENAEEIHCIDSSLCNFVDVCDPKGKLYYYKTDKIPNKWDKTKLIKEWQLENLI